MEVSNHGVEFTAHFENIYQSRYCPYYDEYGRVWSRAYGETDWSGNFNGKCISHSEALNNLRRDLNSPYGLAVNNLNVPLSQNQFDAVTDFVYNLGIGSMEWDVGQSLRARNYYQAANEMLAYRFAGGVELAGLRERREAERNLFLSSPPPAPPNPLSVLYPDERGAVNAWNLYNKHPKLHRHGLQVIYDRMVQMRENIFTAARWGRVGKERVHGGWDINNRLARYEILKHYTLHKP
jgi:lysozyme